MSSVNNSSKKNAIAIGMAIGGLSMLCDNYEKYKEASEIEYRRMLPALRYHLHSFPIFLPEKLSDFISQPDWKNLIFEKMRELKLNYEFAFGLAIHTSHAAINWKMDPMFENIIESGSKIGIQQDKLFAFVRQLKTASNDEFGQILNQFINEQFPDKEDQDFLTSVLFLAADPTNASRLRSGEELREIQEKLQLSRLRGQFQLHQRMAVRPVDISQALLDIQPQIVHFSGHGMATGALCFENQVGETHPIQPDALAALFEQFTNQVSCVILNACYSEIQAAAIAKHIDYVIGMNQAIGDKAAIAFTVGFYQALGAGRTIEEAYKLGCVQIRLQGIPEHLTPVLIKKGQMQS